VETLWCVGMWLVDAHCKSFKRWFPLGLTEWRRQSRRSGNDCSGQAGFKLGIAFLTLF
jgi:hypothetical protein